MTYSSALWPDSLGGVRGDLEGRSSNADLEKAQQYKIAHLLRKARVRPGDRVLEFGSGWGGLAIEVSVKDAVSIIGRSNLADRYLS